MLFDEIEIKNHHKINTDMADIKKLGRPIKDPNSWWFRNRDKIETQLLPMNKIIVIEKISKNQKLLDYWTKQPLVINTNDKSKIYQLQIENKDFINTLLRNSLTKNTINTVISETTTNLNKIIKKEITDNQFDALIIFHMLIPDLNLNYVFSELLRRNELKHVLTTIIKLFNSKLSSSKIRLMIKSLELFTN